MSDARRIDGLTSGRQDWGILRSTCLALAERDDVRLRILAGGMHLAAGYGRTIDLGSDGYCFDILIQNAHGGSVRR